MTTMVDTPGTTLAVFEDYRRTEFGHQFARSIVAADAFRRVEWEKLVDAWLDTKAAKSNSQHTRRNYQRALTRWREFLAGQVVEVDGALQAVEMWAVDSGHVRAWQQSLQATGHSPATIQTYLASVSSFYSFVIDEKRMVNGIEVDLFVDRLGRERQNPFRSNVTRGHVAEYTRGDYLTIDEYDCLLSYLEQHIGTLAGARNHALILTYLHTGWRSQELLRMTWGDLRPSKAQPGTAVFAWRGKGDRHEDDTLPADCYAAILHYLKLAGRYIPGHAEGLQPADFIWTPVTEPDMRGLGVAVDPHQAICGATALRILRTALRKAGISRWRTFRIHDLRHTHAHLLLETNTHSALIQRRLHHKSLATTDRYLRAKFSGDPVDTHSARFHQLRMELR